MKKHSSAAAALVTFAGAFSLVSGFFWKAYAHGRVESTAQDVSRRTVGDSLTVVRLEIQRNTLRIQAQDVRLHRIDSTSAKTCEDMGLVKDILMATFPRRYEEIKRTRDLKK